MEFIFSVARARRLDRELDINVLDGDIETRQLIREKEKHDLMVQPVIFEIQSLLNTIDELSVSTPKSRKEFETNKATINELTDKANQLAEENAELLEDNKKLKNMIEMSMWDFAFTCIPYFTDELDYEDQITLKVIQQFYEEFNKALKTVWTNSEEEEDTGK